MATVIISDLEKYKKYFEEHRHEMNVRMAVAMIEQLYNDGLITYEEMQKIRAHAKKMIEKTKEI